MLCTNLNDVKNWLKVISENGMVIGRYAGADVYQLDSVDHMTILKDNLEEWLAGKDHVTFWHLKQLMINLKNSKVEIPVVATRLNGDLFVDPGGSRITVLKYLKKKTVAVDVVYPRDSLQELNLGEHKIIQDVGELLEPYEKRGVTYSMEMCYDKDCVTCRNNNVVHNGPYRYSVTWDQPWFYREGFQEWHEKNKHRKPADIMDWYTI